MNRGMFDTLDAPSKPATTVIQNGGEAILYASLFSPAESARLFSLFLNKVEWRQDQIRMFGRELPLPRLTAWYGEPGFRYTYSGIPMDPLPWFEELAAVKRKVEAVTGVVFNSVLFNRYRTGKDGVAWHADDEPELGRNPVIGSLSLGATRVYQLRHKETLETIPVPLHSGDYLIMRGELQHHWVHQIPKTSKPVGERINLTFRVIQGK